tara:strand:- start:255 stop:527 length:273 start_codon:yes stop_codon:yes gene_type:complete
MEYSMQNSSNNKINKMRSNRINLAIEALNTIQESQALQELLSKESITTYSEEMIGIEAVNDMEDTVQDFMLLCNFSREEAEQAFNQLENY